MSRCDCGPHQMAACYHDVLQLQAHASTWKALARRLRWVARDGMSSKSLRTQLRAAEAERDRLRQRVCELEEAANA